MPLAAQAAVVLAEAMGYKAEPPPLSCAAQGEKDSSVPASLDGYETPTVPSVSREFPWLRVEGGRSNRAESGDGSGDRARCTPLVVIGCRSEKDDDIKHPPSGPIRI